MGKPLKKKSRKKLYLLNSLLLLIPIAYFGYPFLLGAIGNLLVVDEPPVPSDAIVVLAGGEPGRALEAANLYKAKLAPYVVVTTEYPPAMYEQSKRDGVELVLSYENYVRVLQGYGVPAVNIYRVEEYVGDTMDEIGRVRDFARRKGWKRLIIVTSNFHTRRARMVASFLMEPGIPTVLVSSHSDNFKPDAWWTSQAQVRTFAIEAEKLASYTAYIWPRKLWRLVF